MFIIALFVIEKEERRKQASRQALDYYQKGNI